MEQAAITSLIEQAAHISYNIDGTCCLASIVSEGGSRVDTLVYNAFTSDEESTDSSKAIDTLQTTSRGSNAISSGESHSASGGVDRV
jgi:hypothetical protein